MLDLTKSWFGYLALAIFVIAYILVIFEETTQLRKLLLDALEIPLIEPRRDAAKAIKEVETDITVG